MSMVIRCLSLRIRMSDSPACDSFLRMCSRILMSSMSAPANSFLPTIQFDFQSWWTPPRRPPGSLPGGDDADAQTARMNLLAHLALRLLGLLAARRPDPPLLLFGGGSL